MKIRHVEISVPFLPNITAKCKGVFPATEKIQNIWLRYIFHLSRIQLIFLIPA